MAASRVMKNVMRGEKSPKKGSSATGTGMKGGEKQYKQTGNKSNPKSKSGKNDYDGDEMKLIV